MKPSEKAKEYGTTMKEITEMTGVSRFSQINWFSKRPKLFEIVCWGIRAMKNYSSQNDQTTVTFSESLDLRSEADLKRLEDSLNNLNPIMSAARENHREAQRNYNSAMSHLVACARIASKQYKKGEE